MSLYAVLDDIELEIITWLDGLDMRFGSSYAEQGLIGRKSILQHTGFAPDEVEIQAALHASWCNPAQEVARLKDAMDAARPLAFVLGTGEYRGVFVIAELEVMTRQTDGYGAVMAFECRLLLKEYVGDPAEPIPPGVIREGLRIPIAAEEAQAWMPGEAGGQLGAMGAAAGEAVSAFGAVAQAASDVATLASIAPAAPASAVLMLPGVAASIQQAADGLPIQAFDGLQSVAAVAADAAQVVGAMQSAKGLLDGASSALSGGLSGVSAALWSARAATQALDGAREAVSRIAGMAALRSASAWLT